MGSAISGCCIAAICGSSNNSLRREQELVSMRCMRKLLATLLCCSAVTSFGQQHPRDGEIPDADTKAWWHTTEFLSSDAMEGRDTGSAAYQRAAEYVAGRMKAAGLQPAGENGGYFQTVPMRQVDVVPERTSVTIWSGDRSSAK